MAQTLIAEFGSLPDLLAASAEQVRRAGGSEQAVTAIAAARLVVRRATAARLESRPVLKRSRDLHQYLQAHIGYEPVETVRVLYLDAARRLIADEQAGRGGPDAAPLYVRTVLGRALELSATGIVVAHNHPSGVSRPSGADRLMTNHLAKAAHVVGVALLDHVIVTRGGCNSMMSDVGLDFAKIDASRDILPLLSDSNADAVEDEEVAGSEDEQHIMLIPAGGAGDHVRLAAALRNVLWRRRKRKALFPDGIFSDPCWDILLDLFACELEGVPVSVKSACLAADVPSTTAMRWLERLLVKDVVLRHPDPSDRRRSFVRLSERGRAAMREYVRLASLSSISQGQERGDAEAAEHIEEPRVDERR